MRSKEIRLLRTPSATRSPRLRPAAFFLVTAALAFTSSACSSSGGDGGTGDPPSVPLADVCGGGARLSDVVGPATWLQPGNQTSKGCKFPTDKHVNVKGVRVVEIDRFDETGKGATGNYYVEEGCGTDIGPYSGMTVYAPGFSPPDLRLATGDVVDVLGNLTEFPGPTSGGFPDCRTLPEIGGTMTFRFELGPEINPVTIPVVDLKSYEGARQWLGMLVRVENLKIATDASESSGRLTAAIDVGGGISAGDVPYISNELFDLKNDGPELKEGTTFESVTGIITYFYGFKLAPRSAADFVP